MSYNIAVTKVTQSRLPNVDFTNLPFGRIFTDHMFVADYQDGQWQDLRIVPMGNFELHPAAMVLHYGQAIFEGMKAFKNKAGDPVFFRPEMHSERINASAERLCMPAIPAGLFDEAIHQLVAMEEAWIPPTADSALYLRPFMIATDGFIGVRPSDTYKFMILACPVGPYYAKPVTLYTEQKYVRASVGGVGEAKAAGNYAASLLPAKEAKEKGFDQVMWMDEKEFKYIQEVGTMNIFFVIDGKIITPKINGAILKGITRDSVITLLRDMGYEVEEKNVSIEEIVAAHKAGTLQEAFGTGTAAVVSHVAGISYKGEMMELPAIEERVIAPKTKAMIEGIRSGEVADKFGWIKAVRVLEAV